MLFCFGVLPSLRLVHCPCLFLSFFLVNFSSPLLHLTMAANDACTGPEQMFVPVQILCCVLCCQCFEHSKCTKRASCNLGRLNYQIVSIIGGCGQARAGNSHRLAIVLGSQTFVVYLILMTIRVSEHLDHLSTTELY